MLLADVNSAGDYARLAVLAIAVGGAVGAYFKARPEADKAGAETDLLRTQAQSKIIDDLQSEVDRHKIQLADTERRFRKQLELMRAEHAAEKSLLKDELGELRALNMNLQHRIGSLEARLDAV